MVTREAETVMRPSTGSVKQKYHEPGPGGCVYGEKNGEGREEIDVLMKSHLHPRIPPTPSKPSITPPEIKPPIQARKMMGHEPWS
jgi:hypothetical protein